MVNLSHISDEDNIRLFDILERVLSNQCGCLGGQSLDELESVQVDCLKALNRGEDNKALVKRLMFETGIREI